ncbi:DNA-processing protein DprA [Halofilum ochraceum]|uniref:DNA-processing protein DprA n=1 Tax=Halofilum ochraceum TaxID=1611323 RepID=UPI0008D99E27|nr:DNA-processing protein DprA [Halofilum ochraceum]
MEGVDGWLRIVHAPGVEPVRARELLERFGSPAGIATASGDQLAAARIPAPAIEVLQRRTTPAGIERDLEWAAADHARYLIPLDDPRYPGALAGIGDPPPVLYVLGDPEVLNMPGLAVVGSRHPTPSGRETAYDFARHLAGAGLVIASGLALGIDGAAHEGALAGGGITCAVAGTGLDRIYPARHADLARRIAVEGALVSELPIGTRPSREAFPRRNRILAGNSIGTLVVEAAVRSGSLITARLALEQGREVFAIPGSIHNPVARGCHRLIRQGAKLVETGDDVLEEIANLLGDHWRLASPAAADEDVQEKGAGGSAPSHAQDPEYGRLLACVDWEPRGVDELAAASGLDTSAVASMLLRLELEGAIRVAPGGLYQRA